MLSVLTVPRDGRSTAGVGTLPEMALAGANRGGGVIEAGDTRFDPRDVFRASFLMRFPPPPVSYRWVTKSSSPSRGIGNTRAPINPDTYPLTTVPGRPLIRSRRIDDVVHRFAAGVDGPAGPQSSRDELADQDRGCFERRICM